MKEINSLLQKNLEKKNLTSLSVGAFLINHCKKQSKKPDLLEGYIKRNTLTIKLPIEDDKMSRFVNRINLITTLNELLSENGYDFSIKKIRIL